MSAKALRRFHATATVVWIVLIIPSVLWWSNSVPWLVAMSVWANVGAHFAAWQATRIESDDEERSQHDR